MLTLATIEKRVTKDGTVRWKLRVHIGRDEYGRQRFVRRTFRLKKDAEAEARRLEDQRDHGTLRERSKVTLNQYLRRWLKVKAGEIRARTLWDYRGVIRRYVEKPPDGAPAIGLMRLDRLTPEAFEDLYAWLREHRGLKPRTIQYLHVVLRQALKDAARKGTIARNPTDFVKRPKRARDDDEELEERDAMRAMAEDEANRFIEAARSDRYYPLWLMLLMGGLRPSEALGLRWPSVNIDEGKLHIERILTRIGVKGWKLVPPKTKKARRVVVLPAVAAQALRDWRRKQAEERLLLGAEYEDNGLVFTNPFGKPLHLHNLGVRSFRSICERAGLGEYGAEPVKPKGQPGPRKKRPFRPAHRPYDLRHTCATLLLKKGVPVKIVSELLGHASVALTMDIYSHVLPDMQGTAADAMEAMFGAVSGVTRGSQPDPFTAISGNFPRG